ncbi:hypothetical protein FSP39_021863 [Pinctada imbricata]|uniref:Ionotropic glutamate receptor C-terminal domain-containing protein n=1 Tax=Pinctada imbricata TaxID=66713 RepID=A0AA89BXV2_PINIB|nr:hypothetical protein FSP39_021863 [Pinctada imbricata]
MSSNPQVFVSATEDGIRRVRESKGKYAFMLESVYNEYFNQKEPCNTMQVGPPLSTKGYGIATPKNSSLRDDISITVLQLIEDGSLIKMKKTWWVDKGECGVQDQQQGSKKKSLSLSNIAGGFFILISGLVLAIIVAVVEFQRSKSRGKREGFFLLGSDLTQPLMYAYIDNPYENGQNPLNHCQPSPKSPPKGILTSSPASTSEKQQNDRNDKINGQFSANR